MCFSRNSLKGARIHDQVFVKDDLDRVRFLFLLADVADADGDVIRWHHLCASRNFAVGAAALSRTRQTRGLSLFWGGRRSAGSWNRKQEVRAKDIWTRVHYKSSCSRRNCCSLCWFIGRIMRIAPKLFGELNFTLTWNSYGLYCYDISNNFLVIIWIIDSLQ